MVSQTRFNLSMDLIETGVPFREALTKVEKMSTTEINFLANAFKAWKRQNTIIEKRAAWYYKYLG